MSALSRLFRRRDDGHRYALKLVARADTKTSRKLHETMGRPFDPGVEIDFELEPLLWGGLAPALRGFIGNPDIESITITRVSA